MNILSIRIDNFSKSEVLNKVSEFLLSPNSAQATPGKLQQHKIFTPNPEMLVDAQKDEYFREVLNNGDLNVCDGVGLQFAIRMSPSYQEGEARLEAGGGSCRSLPNTPANSSAPMRIEAPPLRKRRTLRYSGVDLMLDICQLSAEQGSSIYLLGSGSDEVVKRTAEELKKQFPQLKIVGHHPGNNVTMEQCNNGTIIKFDKEDNDELIADIVMARPDILFVAFGHNKQEKWIFENLKDLPSVKIAIGVGGAFDYISGNVKRAPLFLRRIGLEWLYRLIKQPKRIRRIFKATVLFIYLVIKEKILNI